MIDLHSSMTIRQLAVEVAEAAGLADYVSRITEGDNTAGIPTDVGDLDRIMRAVRRGIELVYRADPHWSFATEEYSINITPDGSAPESVGGLSWRYRMPVYIASKPKTGHWVITQGGTVLQSCIHVDPETVWRHRRSQNTLAGAPMYASFTTNAGGDAYETGRAGPDLILSPDPQASFTLQAEFRILPPRKLDLDARHWLGRDHDETVIAAGKFAWFSDDAMDPGKRALYEQQFRERVAESQRIDVSLRRRSNPVLRDIVGTGVSPVRRSRTRTIIVNGVTIQ